MKKLTLNLEALEVETFAVAETHGSGAEAFLTSPDNCMTVSCGDSVVRACMD